MNQPRRTGRFDRNVLAGGSGPASSRWRSAASHVERLQGPPERTWSHALCTIAAELSAVPIVTFWPEEAAGPEAVGDRPRPTWNGCRDHPSGPGHMLDARSRQRLTGDLGFRQRIKSQRPYRSTWNKFQPGGRIRPRDSSCGGDPSQASEDPDRSDRDVLAGPGPEPLAIGCVPRETTAGTTRADLVTCSMHDRGSV